MPDASLARWPISVAQLKPNPAKTRLHKSWVVVQFEGYGLQPVHKLNKTDGEL
jgi:hypothetical protein